MKTFWLAAFSIAIASLSYHCYAMTMAFLKYEKTTGVSLQYDGQISFPALSFCSLNAFKFSELWRSPTVQALMASYNFVAQTKQVENEAKRRRKKRSLESGGDKPKRRDKRKILSDHCNGAYITGNGFAYDSATDTCFALQTAIRNWPDAEYFCRVTMTKPSGSYGRLAYLLTDSQFSTVTTAFASAASFWTANQKTNPSSTDFATLRWYDAIGGHVMNPANGVKSSNWWNWDNGVGAEYNYIDINGGFTAPHTPLYNDHYFTTGFASVCEVVKEACNLHTSLSYGTTANFDTNFYHNNQQCVWLVPKRY